MKISGLAVASGLVAILFAFSAAMKARGHEFFHYLAGTRMFPADLVHVVGWSIILLEAATAVMLVWPRSRALGWLVTASMCSTFAVFHAFAATLGELPACPCLGFQITRQRLPSHLILGAICVGVAVMAGYFFRQRANLGIAAVAVPSGLQEAK
jgi:hypothetical protein